MSRAIEILLVEEHVFAEPAGAASTAALLAGGAEFGDNVVLVVSGANISRDVFAAGGWCRLAIGQTKERKEFLHRGRGGHRVHREDWDGA